MGRFLLTLVALATATSAHALEFDFEGRSDDEIRDTVGRALRATAAEVVPTATTRLGALDAAIALTQVRVDAFQELATDRRMTSMESIILADALDDSLVAQLGRVFDVYREAQPDPTMNAGAERFNTAIDNMGFVSANATGFLVHFEMQQSLGILAEFRERRSELEVEGAEDAFLRHYGLLCDLFEVQHSTLDGLHASNVANMEWAIGRFETEEGVGNFFLANQFLSFRNNQLGYLLKLQSHETGEVVDVNYPLPWLTKLDPGYESLEKSEKQKTTDG